MGIYLWEARPLIKREQPAVVVFHGRRLGGKLGGFVPPRRPKVHNLEQNLVERSFECYFAAFVKKNFRNFLAPTAQMQI